METSDINCSVEAEGEARSKQHRQSRQQAGSVARLAQVWTRIGRSIAGRRVYITFSESESDGEHDDATQAALQTAQIAGGTAASQAADDLKSWVFYMRSLTERARAKMGRQARPVLVMSMCSGIGTHTAAMKVGQHRLRLRHFCMQARGPDRFPSRVGSTDRPGRPSRDRQCHCQRD